MIYIYSFSTAGML